MNSCLISSSIILIPLFGVVLDIVSVTVSSELRHVPETTVPKSFHPETSAPSNELLERHTRRWFSRQFVLGSQFASPIAPSIPKQSAVTHHPAYLLRRARFSLFDWKSLYRNDREYDLKAWPKPFSPVLNGTKKYELRVNDVTST
jgi:hypothetical protein